MFLFSPTANEILFFLMKCFFEQRFTAYRQVEFIQAMIRPGLQ